MFWAGAAGLLRKPGLHSHAANFEFSFLFTNPQIFVKHMIVKMHQTSELDNDGPVPDAVDRPDVLQESDGASSSVEGLRSIRRRPAFPLYNGGFYNSNSAAAL